MLATHAKSVFTNSCLSTPRGPKLPTDHEEPSTSSIARSSFPKSPLEANSKRPLKHLDGPPQDIDSFGVSLRPGSPYIQHSPISPRGNALPGRRNNGAVNSDAIAGNERHSSDDETQDYATLFATLLESNTLLREEIQSLKEQQTNTREALVQLSVNDELSKPPLDLNAVGTPICSGESGKRLTHSLPQVLENTWVEPKIHTPSNAGSVSNSPLHSCPSSEHSLQTLSSTDDNAEGSLDLCNDETETAGELAPEEFHSEIELQHTAQVDDSDSETASISVSCLSSSTNSAYFREQENPPQNDPFASPGVLAVEKMWDGFSVDDYNFEPESGHSTSEKKPKEWTPKITIPQPFAMTIRESTTPKQKSQSILIAEREEIERRANEEAELKKQFRATPVPAHTFLPLYDLVNAKNEQRREQIKLQSKEILRSTEKPFSFSKREEAKKQAKAEFVQQNQKFERAREREEKQFRAKPIPKHVFDPNTDEKIKEQEEYRRIRMQMRAEELLASSKFPGSMQAKGKEYTVGSLRKKWLERKEKHAFLTNDHKFYPSIHNDVPDYNQAYENFHRELAKRKHTKPTTVTEPFYLRTELIPSRKNKPPDDLKTDKEAMSEIRWPFIAARKKVPRKSSTRPNPQRSTSEGGIAYPAQMTATSRFRQSLTEERLAGILAEEKAEEMKRKEKEERDKELKATLSQKTLPHDPTAWLEDKQREKLQQFRQEDRKRQRIYHQQLEKMKQRVESRPLLLEQVSLHTLRKSAEAKYISALKKAGVSDEDIQELNKKQPATLTD